MADDVSFFSIFIEFTFKALLPLSVHQEFKSPHIYEHLYDCSSPTSKAEWSFPHPFLEHSFFLNQAASTLSYPSIKLPPLEVPLALVPLSLNFNVRAAVFPPF